MTDRYDEWRQRVRAAQLRKAEAWLLPSAARNRCEDCQAEVIRGVIACRPCGRRRRAAL